MRCCGANLAKCPIKPPRKSLGKTRVCRMAGPASRGVQGRATSKCGSPRLVASAVTKRAEWSRTAGPLRNELAPMTKTCANLGQINRLVAKWCTLTSM